MSNSFGTHFRITSFGESHGAALGAVIDGCPSNVIYREDVLLKELARRRPGQHGLVANQAVSARQENDSPEILSGVFEGKTLGTPIAILVRNRDAKSQDYEKIAQNPRAGHADDVWINKFGHRDPRGGGRSSGRETLARVLGGSFARMFLSQTHPELKITAYTLKIGPFALTEIEQIQATEINVDDYTSRFPSSRHLEVKQALQKIQAEGESWGGVAEVKVSGMPSSLGQPIFHKLKSDLAMAMMSVGATSAFELGEGMVAALKLGTETHTSEKPYGGIRGGISTGEDLLFRVHFKPTSSILDVAKQGRHDPCIVPRAIPVLEAMTALVLADHVLWRRLDQV